MVSRRRSAHAGRVCSAAERSEAGVTMVELVVTMFVFAIFLVVMTSSLIGITKASTQAQTVARSSTGVLNVFQAFDRAIRYADVINPPGSTSNGRYVEFRTPASTTGRTATCTQWRYVPSSKTLQSRTWPDGVDRLRDRVGHQAQFRLRRRCELPLRAHPGRKRRIAHAAAHPHDRRGQCRAEDRVGLDDLRRAQQHVRSNSGGLVCSAGTMRP